MRSYSLALACALAMLSTQAFAQVSRANCPADPEKAGYLIWPPSTLKAGEVKRAKDPSGRLVECTRAKPGDQRRACRWL